MPKRRSWQPITDVLAEDQTLFGSRPGPHLCNLSAALCELAHPGDGRRRRSSDKPATCGCHGGHRDGDHPRFSLLHLFESHMVEEEGTPTPAYWWRLVVSSPAWRTIVEHWPRWRTWYKQWRRVVARTRARSVPAKRRRLWRARLERLRTARLHAWRSEAQARVCATADGPWSWHRVIGPHRHPVGTRARLVEQWHRGAFEADQSYRRNLIEIERLFRVAHGLALRPRDLVAHAPRLLPPGQGLESAWPLRSSLAIVAGSKVRWPMLARSGPDDMRWGAPAYGADAQPASCPWTPVAPIEDLLGRIEALRTELATLGYVGIGAKSRATFTTTALPARVFELDDLCDWASPREGAEWTTAALIVAQRAPHLLTKKDHRALGAKAVSVGLRVLRRKSQKRRGTLRGSTFDLEWKRAA